MPKRPTARVNRMARAGDFSIHEWSATLPSSQMERASGWGILMPRGSGGATAIRRMRRWPRGPDGSNDGWGGQPPRTPLSRNDWTPIASTGRRPPPAGCGRSYRGACRTGRPACLVWDESDPYADLLLSTTDILAFFLPFRNVQSLKPIAGLPVARTGRRLLRLASGVGLY